MDKFLLKKQLSKVDISNRNSNNFRTILEIEAKNKAYFYKENITGNFYQTLKQEIALILHKLF